MNYIFLSELLIYHVVFIGVLLYSLIKFSIVSQQLLPNIDKNDLLMNNGAVLSQFLDRPLDVTDLEWQVFKKYYLQWKIVFIFCHSIGFYLTRRFWPNFLCLFIIAYSFLVLPYLLTLKCSLILVYLYIFMILFFQFFFQKTSIRTKLKPLFYIVFACSLSVIHKINFDHENNERNFLVQVAFSWLSARSLSCSLDSVDDEYNFQSLLVRVAYLLYFPPFFFGPIYQFSDFKKSILVSQNYSAEVHKGFSFQNFLLLIRFLFWALVLEVVFHYFYSSAFQFYVFLLESFDTWSLCGFGFALMIFFFVKYFIIYGTTRALAIIDGFDEVIAKPPECIAHMNKTSHLWRKFDRGLYLFLIKYFYKPLTGSKYESKKRRFLAASVCFGIVAVWHGYYDAVIVWVVLNIFLVCSELFCATLCQTNWYSKTFSSPLNQLRIEAFFGSPYLMIAYLSNIFFLSNYQTGMLFVKRIFMNNSYVPLVSILIVLYSGCHVCKFINKKHNYIS